MQPNLRIPFLDLAIDGRNSGRAEIMAEIGRVIDRTAFAGGEFVTRFEEDFAAYCGARRAIGVGSGTEALWLALRALGVEPGDEVVTVPNSFIATAEAISACGARPVFVDVDERTQTLDPNRLEAALTSRTKAVIPVHLYGQTADMDPILAIARNARIAVVEDACQAHGAEYRGRRAGSIGDAGCFSFYPSKNLGAWGEAGAVTTNNPELADRIALLRDHGQAKKYHHSEIGWNGRMDGIQAAVLRIKLKHLDPVNAARRNLAQLYDELLSGVDGVRAEGPADWGRHVYHLYVVRVAERDRVLTAMADRGIGCAVHYPRPIHLQECYRFLNQGEGSFPVAERCAGEILSLPMYPDLDPGQVETVARELAALAPEGAGTPAIHD